MTFKKNLKKIIESKDFINNQFEIINLHTIKVALNFYKKNVKVRTKN